MWLFRENVRYSAGVKNVYLLGAVLVVQSDSCREEGPAETLLCASRMQQSVTEGALQYSNISMHGVGDSVYQRCYFCQSFCLPSPALDPGCILEQSWPS